MITLPIKTQKFFDEIMTGVSSGVVKVTQKKNKMVFFRRSSVFEIDFVNYYNFFDSKKHGPDPVLWEEK